MTPSAPSVLRIGKLTDIAGYVPVQKTTRYRQEAARYKNLKVYIPLNAALMLPIVFVTYLFVRRAIVSPHAVVRWLVSALCLGGGAFGILAVFFVVTIGFYGDSRTPPGGRWAPEYEQSMARHIAATLLGHEPRDVFQMQVGDAEVLANPEIFLVTDSSHYGAVPASAVTGIRKLTRAEIDYWYANLPGVPSYNPNGEVVAFIFTTPAYHEQGTTTRGGFEIMLRNEHPHGIWIGRDGFGFRDRIREDDDLTNDVFEARLMQALHPAAAPQSAAR